MRLMYVVFLPLLLVMVGCSSSTEENNIPQVPSKLTALLFSGNVGTTYVFKTTNIHYGDNEKDTTYSHNRYTIKNKNAVLANGKTAMEVELLQDNGLSERLFFSATDSTLYRYTYFTGTSSLLESLLLQTPLTTGATFSRGGNLPGTFVKIANTGASVTVPKGKYTAVQVVQEYTNYIGTTKQDFNETWYYVSGTLWVKHVTTQTLTPQGGNPALNVETEELVSIQ